MKNLKLSQWNNLGSILIGMLSLLMTSAPGTGCGPDRGIPVLVTIRTPAENLPSAELTVTLNGARFATIKPNHPTSPFVLYVPAGSSGRLDLSVVGRDRDDCVSEGRTQLAVVSNPEGVLEANIDIDASVYPQCKLTVKVLGNGTVTDTDGRVRCSGAGGVPCTMLIHKQTQVGLRAKESGIDSDFEEWQGACTYTADSCEFKVDGPKEVVATFRPRRCRPDGSCESVARAEPEPPNGYLYSSNARWAVRASQEVVLRKSGVWKQVGKLESPAYALWGNQDYVWIMTKSRQVVRCKEQGCQPLALGSEPTDGPATLFSFGGSGNEFWAVDKRSVHRCGVDSCKAEPLPSIQLSQEGSRAKILIAFWANNSVSMAGQFAQSPNSSSCSYFAQTCSVCATTELSKAAPCQLGAQIRSRFETGIDSAMWVQLSDRLYRVSGSSASYVGKPSDLNGLFLPEVVKEGLSGQREQFLLLVGEAGKISRLRRGQDISILTSGQPGLMLRDAWISSTGDAWVVGDNGTAFFCSVNATSADGCMKISTVTTDDLVQIQQDGTRLWAFSRSGAAFPLK